MSESDPVSIRAGRASDAAAIRNLFVTVASRDGNLARAADEMTEEYVDAFISASLADGVLLIAELRGITGIAGELHAYCNGIRRFAHVLGGLTVAVHPEAQGRGIGRQLFETLLDDVRRNRPMIERIELVTSESNVRARKLYESLGFRQQGRFERGIRSPRGELEADIPMAWLREEKPP